jgi:hypothetical protein
MLSEEVADLIQTGVAMVISTSDPHNKPALVRGFGAVVDPNRTQITIYVPEVPGRRTLQNLETNPRLAVVFVRTSDYLAYQVKGRCLAVRACGSVDRELQRRYLEQFYQAVREVGLVDPERWAPGPTTAVEFAVEAVFDQTPGGGR